MYRIRFPGRDGHGIKTGARILGSAFFTEGFEVQDAPRYGAERRGAGGRLDDRAAARVYNALLRAGFDATDVRAALESRRLRKDRP